jgi:opacity protein-like surface antigen
MKRNILLLTLVSCVALASTAMAQADLGLKNAGVALGFVNVEDIDGTFSVGVFANHGTIAPRVGLESRIDFWSKSEDEFGVEVSVRDIAIGARAKYYFDVASTKVQPFAGAGLGIHFLAMEVSMPPIGGSPGFEDSESETRLGLDLGGGLSTPIGPRTDFLAEAWYGIVSDVNQFSLRAGLAWKLGS